MFKALGLGTFVRGDDDDDEDLDGSEGSELFEEAAGDVAPAKDKEEASAAAPAPARIPPRNESGTGNGTPRHAARRGPNSPVIASGRVSRLTTVTSRLSPYSRPPKTPRTTAVTPGGEKSATGGFLSILRGFASPALSLIRRSPQRDDSEEDESDEDELSGSFKSNGAAGGVKEKPMQRVEAAFESEDDEPILKRKPSASVANTPLISTKGPASPPPFISTRAFADIPSSSTPGVSREEATKATSQLISSPTGFSFKPPTSPSKKSTAPANDFRPSPVSPPKRTDSVFSFKTVGAAPTVDIQQSDAEKPLAVAFSDKPASAFAEKPAGAFSFVNPPRTESGMDVDRPSTAPRDTRLGAYSEIANLLARKGDEPLDVEEAARVQQLLKKTIVAPPSFGFHSAGASSSQALVRTASVKGAKAPLWQSIFKPGASTLGPSSVVTAVHDATVTIRPPRRRQEPHYGASFGFTSNPYKRSLGAGRPHPQWTAPRLGEPSSKRQKVVDKQDSMDGGDIAAGVISAALDDVKPPTKLLTPLGEGFTGTNPYERDISNRVGYEMPTFSAKPKVAAIVREVKSKTVGPVGSSAILRARIKGKSVAFATGTPVKRSEGAEFAKTPGITRPQTASKKRATERAVGTAKGTASTSAAFGVATSVIVEDLGTPAVLPKDVSMGEASPAFGMAPKAQEAFGGVTLKEAGPPATPSAQMSWARSLHIFHIPYSLTTAGQQRRTGFEGSR
ncbi:hypothetical protein HK101_004753 [Irineochytrium annulatum]|nr:hypothetical protein HK101_004753 [Irineochytrium annulatum]